MLGVPAVVSGVVTDSRGRGLQNARITAYQEDSGDWSYVADVTTDSTGGYRVAGLAADRYKLRFSDAGVFTYYLTEWFDDQATADVASTIDLVSGDAVTADATLAHVADITSISSSTHGVTATWYRSTDAAFDWLTAGPSMSAAEATQIDAWSTAVAGYSYSVDGSPDTPADKRLISTTPSAAVTVPGDGLWYFHVRAAAQPVLWDDWWFSYRPTSWAPTSTYAFRVDATPPAVTVTRPEEGAGYVQGSDVTCAWSASDATSGIVSEVATIDGAPIGKGDRLDTLAMGEHVFILAVTDAAGGVTEVTRHFSVTSGSFSAIDVTAPVGGESLAQGADLPVAWTTNAAVDAGEFSLWLVSPANSWYGGAIVPADGTASYAAGLPADVPAAAGYRVFVYYRVTPTDPWSIYGFAAGTVEVTAPAFSAIDVTAPVGGESLAQGADLPVAWTTNAAVDAGEFSLWLVSPANSWYGGAIVPADGTASYAAGLPADVPAAAGYRVFVYYRVTPTDPWSIYGFAAGTVEVTAPAFSAIDVTAPVGGESLAQGADLPVAWTTNAAVDAGEFSLWLVSPANSWYGGAIVPADGTASYAAGLPADVPAAAGYRVFVYYRVTPTDPWSIYGFAAGTVEVTAPAFSAIDVTAPVGGESLAQGADLPVAWTTNAAVDAGEFSLWLVSPANSWYGGAIVPADGTASYAAGLPADVPAAAGYRVFVYYRVTPTDPWSIYGFAAGTVEVTAPAFSAIDVTAPVGGESLAQGADLPVAWTTNAAVDAGEFSLWLVSPANSWYGGAIVPADGTASYAAGLPADVPAAAGYRVFVYYRVTPTDPWSIYGFAAGTVEVTAPAFSAIDVTAPVGGESLAQGADLPVAWTTNAAVDAGEFSLWLVSPANSWYGGAIVPADGTASYAAGLPADVPAAAGYRVFVYYRVTPTDPWSIYGFAAGTVEVTAPAFSAIDVTAPVGGESLAQGADLPVAWTTNAAVDAGEFSLWLVSPANSWYGGAIVPADGTASYAAGLPADVPAAAGYRVFVYYRVTPTDPWSIYGFAAGTVEVTAP